MTKDDELDYLDETLMQLDHSVRASMFWSVATFMLLLINLCIVVVILMFKTW